MKYFKRIIFIIVNIILFNTFTSAQEFTNTQNKMALNFTGLPSLQAEGNAVRISVFSDYLKVIASGRTQLNGRSVNFSVSLTLPAFNYLNDKQNTYANSSTHFFIPQKDAVLSITIDTFKYETLYRSRDSGKFLPNVRTTDYSVQSNNIQEGKGNYFININVNPGTVLKISSDTLTAEKVMSTTIADRSIFSIINPKPIPIKVDSSHVFIEQIGTKQNNHL